MSGYDSIIRKYSNGNMLITAFHLLIILSSSSTLRTTEEDMLLRVNKSEAFKAINEEIVVFCSESILHISLFEFIM
jgi:hypothetical protein